MKLHLCFAALAATLLAGSATAQSRSNLTQADADRAFEAIRVYVADSSRWMGLHNQIVMQRWQRLNGLQVGAQAIEQTATHDQAEARAAVARWATDQQTGLAEDRAAFNALPAAPRLNLSPALMAIPELRDEIRGPVAHIESLPPRYAGFFNMTDGFAQDYFSAVTAAVDARDAELAFQLAHIDFGVAVLKSESALMEASLPPEGVQRFVSMATIHSNAGLTQWLEHLGDTWRETPLNRAGRAEAIRASASQVRSDTDQLLAAAAAQNREQVANPALATTAGRSFSNRYHASFVESARIEREMADLLDKLAEALASGDDTAAMTLEAQSQPLKRRRTEAQLERQGLLQQLSSPAF